MIYPTVAEPWIPSDLFSVFNMSLFALTNGWATTACMILAPSFVHSDEKETAGFMMTFPLTFGILAGTFLALLLQNIGN
jgi:hypothetical protein